MDGMDGLSVYLDSEGYTEYAFKGNLKITKGLDKGLGLELSDGVVNSLEDIVSVQSSIFSPVGAYKQKMCFYCLRMLSKKERLSCSEPICREAGKQFDLVCSPVLGQLSELNEDDADICVMLIRALFCNYAQQSQFLGDPPTIGISPWMNKEIRDLVYLNGHQNEQKHRFDELSANIFKIIVRSSSSLCLLDPLYVGIVETINAEKIVKNRLETLLRAIQYNLYALPVPALPNTRVIVVSASLARINHNCCPNCIVLYSLPFNCPPLSIRLHLRALKNISSGTEISVSYLADPVLPVDTRRELLRVGFHFLCACTRCEREMNNPHPQLLTEDETAGDKAATLLLRLASEVVQDMLLERERSPGENKRSGYMQWDRKYLLKVVSSLEKSLKLKSQELNLLVVNAFVDLSLAVLRRLMSGGGSNIAEDSSPQDVLLDCALLVRAYKVLSDCSTAQGNRVSHRRLDSLLAGVTSGVRLVAQAKAADADKDPGAPDLVKEVAAEAVIVASEIANEALHLISVIAVKGTRSAPGEVIGDVSFFAMSSKIKDAARMFKVFLAGGY